MQSLGGGVKPDSTVYLHLFLKHQSEPSQGMSNAPNVL